MSSNPSKLSTFLKGLRGTKSYRDFAQDINNTFTYSYIKLIEDDKRSPLKSKFIKFAVEYGKISADDALAMWVDQKRIYETNKKFASRIRALEQKGKMNDPQGSNP